MKRKIILLLTSIVAIFSMNAQIVNAVSWTSKHHLTSDNEGVMEFTAKIEPGYHMYSLDKPADDGPVSLSFTWDKLQGVTLKGKLTPSKAAHRQMDEVFGMELSWWEGTVTIKQVFTVTQPNYVIEGHYEYMACNDENCVAPTTEDFTFSGKAPITAAAEAQPTAAQPEAVAADTATSTGALAVAPDSVANSQTMADSDLWAPVDAVAGETDGAADASSSSSLIYIIIACFLGGLVALLTPCVWPMIPLTVSFFLKKSGNRAKSIRDAITYGLSIIIIYVLLGMLITLIFGASSLNALATSAVCNIIFFLLLVVFAISFFGAFEIKLPDSWSNKMDSAAEKTTGLLSIFFMAFTLALVSFSCTGPIIGTLLVEAASQGNIIGPAVGMFSFSLALAIPFCLFAMFPSLLNGLPKSGGWMNTVKVVLGFIELALSLKFLSVADLAYGWHILDRETFIALWIATFGLLGLYLLGKFSFSHYGPAKGGIGVFRFFLAFISFSFVVYLLPGLWGAPLKSVSAFVPPLSTQDFNLYGGNEQIFEDYEEGMKAAERMGKPVLIDFSGYGCVNCRKMEAAVLDNEQVKQNINSNFVMIRLMVDEKASLPEPIKVSENGKTTTLRTVGDKWSYLQRYKFRANAQPYYVVLNNQGRQLSGPFVYEENIDGFINFLNKGANAYKAEK
ncbi:MAG: cytochrome c biogenesis protein CcdA [Muribaculaceae bacterium]